MPGAVGCVWGARERWRARGESAGWLHARLAQHARKTASISGSNYSPGSLSRRCVSCAQRETRRVVFSRATTSPSIAKLVRSATRSTERLLPL